MLTSLLERLQQHPRARLLASVRVEGQDVLRLVVVDLLVDVEVDHPARALRSDPEPRTGLRNRHPHASPDFLMAGRDCSNRIFERRLR